MSFLPIETLRTGADQMGIELSDEQLHQFDRYAAFLVETNNKFNLTRITDPLNIVTGHILDSLTCLKALDVKQGASIIDVGTGAGLPGIAIKIVHPDIRVTLLDATFKKISFLAEAITLLGLEEIKPIHARAEEIGHEKDYREHFDAAYARALSELRVLAELCLPLVRVGGYVVAQKSTDIAKELAAARPVIGQLGGRISEAKEIDIPHTEIRRKLIVISKTKPTPQSFPRSYSRITKGH